MHSGQTLKPGTQWEVWTLLSPSQEALQNLEMPRFARRYPAILNTLMRQMLGLVQVCGQQYACALCLYCVRQHKLCTKRDTVCLVLGIDVVVNWGE